MLTSRRKRTVTQLHWPLLAVVAAIAALGCYNLHSAAAHNEPRLYVTQAIWFGLGALGIVACLIFDYRLTETVAYALYGTVVSMLVAVLLLGKSAMGARRWLRLGPLTFQPSEVAKLAVIFCLARYFSQRVVAEGYSIRALVRPLNLTRPASVLLGLALFWQAPALVDPVGELARWVHRKLAGAPAPLEDLLWFRVACLCAIGLGLALCLLWVVRAERAVALLNPWPAGRRRRLLVLLGLLATTLTVCVVTAWQAPVMKDPFGVALVALDAAATDGAHVQLHPTPYARAALLALAIGYAAAALLHWRSQGPTLAEALVAPFDLLLVPALLVLVQPDLGTAGIVFCIGMTMMLVVGIQARSLLLMSFWGAVVAGAAWFGVLKDYQKRRILTFIDPEQDVRGAGWNAVQSLIAVGSGRWFGKGHKGGTQTQLSFLPEQHTDFAFSVWAEEQGFFGCALLLLLYLLLVGFAFGVARRARDAYGALLATGLTALILWQAVINVGMVIGVLPVVGITLPLFSYGGSSVLTVAVAVGLLLNVHWRRRA